MGLSREEQKAHRRYAHDPGSHAENGGDADESVPELVLSRKPPFYEGSALLT